jgi:hypothetical protein
VFDHVKQKNGTHALAQRGVQIREVRLPEDKAAHLFMYPGTAGVAAVSVESVRAQQANVVTSSCTDLQDRVTLLAKGASEISDDSAARAVPIMKLIARGVCFIELVTAEFGATVGIIDRRTHFLSATSDRPALTAENRGKRGEP